MIKINNVPLRERDYLKFKEWEKQKSGCTCYLELLGKDCSELRGYDRMRSERSYYNIPIFDRWNNLDEKNLGVGILQKRVHQVREILAFPQICPRRHEICSQRGDLSMDDFYHKQQDC